MKRSKRGLPSRGYARQPRLRPSFFSPSRKPLRKDLPLRASLFCHVLSRLPSHDLRARRSLPRRAMSSFIRALSQLKVKEVPEFIQKQVTVRNITEYAKTSFSEYRTKYILPGSPTPIYHVMGGVFLTAYITVWPSEYRHMIAAKNGAH